MRKAPLLILALVMLCTGASFGADGTIWFGRPDSIPLVFRVDSEDTVELWIQTNPDVYAAAIHIPLSSADRFITKRLGGRLFKPFAKENPPPEGFDKGWDSAEIRKPIPHKDKPGFTSQGILGFSNLFGKPNVPLHCEEPCKIAEFYVHTAADSSLKGHTFEVFFEGYEYPSQGINLSDTLGIRTFQFDVFYSKVHFLYPGDVNADFKIDKDDIELLRLYLKGEKELPWPDLRGDANNDNIVDKKDLQWLENYLKQ